MQTKFTVFDENGRVVTTTAADSWSGGKASLVRKTKLYVDTGERMVFTYLEGKTSLLRGGSRVENLYFQYNASSDENPVEGLIQFIEALQHEDAKSPSVENNDLRPITEAEAFEYSWEIQQAMSRGGERLLWQVAQATPELPTASPLFQDVIKELAMKGTQLRLGMEDYASTAQAFRYFIELPRDITVAVPDQGNEPANADIILFPGAKENYNGEDTATKKAIKKEWDSVLSSYTENKLTALKSKVATLEEQSSSLLEFNHDLIQLRRCIENGEPHSSQFHSSKAASAYELYVETQQETEVPESSKKEIATEFLESLNKRIDDVQTEIVAAEKEKLEESLEKINGFQFNEDYKKYVTFKKLKEIVNSEHPLSQLGPQEPEDVKDFADKTEELNRHREILGSVIEEVKADLSDTIDGYITDERETIVDAKTEDLEEILDTIEYGRKINVEELYKVLTLFENVVSGELEIDTAPDNISDTILDSGYCRRIKDGREQQKSQTPVEKLFEEIWTINTHPKLADDEANEILDRVQSDIIQRQERQQRIQHKSLRENLDSKINRLSGSSEETQTALHELDKLRECCALNRTRDCRSSYDYFQQVAEGIQAVKDSSWLTGDQKTDLLSNAESKLAEYHTDWLKKYQTRHKNRIISQIQNLEQQKRADRDGGLRELEVMEKILANRGLNESLTAHDPTTRRLNDYVRELNQDGYLADESKEQIIKTAKQNVERARQQLNGGRESKPADDGSGGGIKGTPSENSDASNGGIKETFSSSKAFHKPSTMQVVLGAAFLLVCVLVFGLFLGPSIPFVPTDDSATITYPGPGENVTSDQLRVIGTTESSTVTVSAQHTQTGNVSSEKVDVSDGQFVADFGVLPAGEYQLTVSSKNETRDTQRITFLGNDQSSPEPANAIMTSKFLLPMSDITAALNSDLIDGYHGLYSRT